MQQTAPKIHPLLIVALFVLMFGGIIVFPMLQRSCVPAATIPALPEADMKRFLDYMAAHAKPPADFILESFAARDVVFVGDLFFNATFGVIRKLIPALYGKGVRTIGFEHALSTDQGKIDAFMAAVDFNEEQAKEILNNSFAVFGLSFGSLSHGESLVFFKELWTFNHSLARGARPMRLLGLGPYVDMKILTDKNVKDDIELKKKAFNNMTLEEAYFNVIQNEVIKKKEKALLYMVNFNFYKNSFSKKQTEEYKKFGLEYKGTITDLVSREIKDRVLVVFFHNAWMHNQNGEPTFPLGGVLDAVMRGLPAEKRAGGFFLKDSPFKDLPLASGFVNDDNQPVLLKDVCDAYILNGELYQYRMTPLAFDAFDKNAMAKILSDWGRGEDVTKGMTAPEFITQVNGQIDKLNQAISQLPR